MRGHACAAPNLTPMCAPPAIPHRIPHLGISHHTTPRPTNAQPYQPTCRVSRPQPQHSVVHKFEEPAQKLTFTLDDGAANLVIKEANGLWFVESEGEGLREGHVRVWLQASLRVSRVVPKWVSLQ